MQFQCVVPCHFGLEAVLKRELTDLGFKITRTEDGRVTFTADERGIARANINLRTCERVLLQAARFKAETFDELFEKTKAVEWEKFLTKDARFWVKKASSVKSKLFSPSDIQKIVKKAVVERLKTKYHIEWFPETGAEYPLRVFIYKDEVLLTLDTSGESLHKRGYRKLASKAPISETLAAALIMLTPWKGDRILVDPFCGSGTFCIEAAMMAASVAPGAKRHFLSEGWPNLIEGRVWKEAFEEVSDLIRTDIHPDIQGYDIDGNVLKIARRCAEEAGVKNLIHFQQRDMRALSHSKPYGFIITNPPYGERLENKKNLPELYSSFGQSFAALDKWSAAFITSYEDAGKNFEKGIKTSGESHLRSFQSSENESYVAARDDNKFILKKRKIYNGMIEAVFYQYMGKKPKKASAARQFSPK